MTVRSMRHHAVRSCAARVATSALLGFGLAFASIAGLADISEGRGGYSLL